MAEAEKFRVLAVADGMIPSVELVLERPLTYLSEKGALRYSLHTVSEVEQIALELERCDLLIVMRACQPDALALVEDAVSKGIPVIYAIDDDFESLDPATPLGQYYLQTGGWKRLTTICGLANQVWAFSDVLKKKLQAVQPNIVVPPAIASLETIDELRQELRRPSSVGPRRTIGYAASLLHSTDVDSVAPVLKRLLSEFKDLHIELVGVRCEALLDHPRVQHFPALPSIKEYYRFVLSRHWDVGIAPLLRSPSNDAKTDNKYREYAAVGIPAVYSDAPSYWRSVIDGYNGIIANTADDWLEGLTRLLTDDNYAKRLCTNAADDVESRYGIENVSRKYLDYMESAVEPALNVLVIAAAIATTAIDITLPFGRLKSEGKLDWRTMDGSEVTPEDLMWADVLVISRLSDPATVQAARLAKQEYDLPVVFSWDDDFFTIPESIGAVAKYHRDPVILRGLEELLQASDLIKASTQRIADRSRLYNQNVVQHPYGFDFSQLETMPQHIPRKGGAITIGFFGSADHSAALEALLGALERVATLSPETRFEFFGPKSKKLENLPRTTFIPFSPSSGESIRTLVTRHWDIGLSPLEISDFNRAKLPTKYRDYGACQIAGIYTAIDPYEAVVTDGKTGLLVGNEQEAWVDAIMRLVGDPNLRRDMAANAHAHVRNQLSLDQSVDAWRSVLKAVSPVSNDSVAVAARQQRKIQVLEARVDHLARQVGALKDAGRRLLMLNGRSADRVPRSGSLIHRGLNKLIAIYLRTSPILSAVGPVDKRIEEFAQSIFGGDASDGIQYGTSVNLQTVPFVEYRIVRTPAPGKKLRAAFAATVPTLSGYLGMELVSPSDEIHDHVILPIELLSADLLVDFPLDGAGIPANGWRVRFFARQSQSPIYVRECATASHERTALFDIVSA